MHDSLRAITKTGRIDRAITSPPVEAPPSPGRRKSFCSADTPKGRGAGRRLSESREREREREREEREREREPAGGPRVAAYFGSLSRGRGLEWGGRGEFAALGSLTPV